MKGYSCHLVRDRLTPKLFSPIRCQLDKKKGCRTSHIRILLHTRFTAAETEKNIVPLRQNQFTRIYKLILIAGVGGGGGGGPRPHGIYPKRLLRVISNWSVQRRQNSHERALDRAHAHPWMIDRWTGRREVSRCHLAQVATAREVDAYLAG